MHPDERQIERAENTTFISVNDTPSLNGKATRTDGWGTDFSEVICWSNHGIRMDALFRHKLFFFLSFSRVDTFFVLFTYTQSERLRIKIFLQMGSSNILLGLESIGQCIVQRQRKCKSSYQASSGHSATFHHAYEKSIKKRRN